jgi:hypothetical protein
LAFAHATGALERGTAITSGFQKPLGGDNRVLNYVEKFFSTVLAEV